MTDMSFDVLIIDGNSSDSKLIKKILQSDDPKIFNINIKSTLHDAVDYLKSDNDTDIILLELSLPDSFGMQTLNAIQHLKKDIPIIILSGFDNRELAIRAVQEGVQDYLVKSEVNSDMLTRTIRYAIERQNTEHALRSQKLELEILNKVISSGNISQTLDELLDRILGSTLELMNLDFGAVHIVDEQKKVASLRISKGMMGGLLEHEPETIPINIAPYDEIFMDSQIVVLEDLESERPSFFKSFGIKSITRLPLKTKGKVIGSLSVGSYKKSKFNEQERKILLALRREAATSIGKMIAEEQLKEYTEQIERDLIRKKESIHKAQLLQQNLNTKIMPTIAGINISSLFMPSEELGGDYFDIRKTGDRLLVIIADCVGHGLEASMDATLLKLIADRHIGYLAVDMAGQFLENVNKDVLKYFHRQNYPTMFACSISLSTKELFYANSNSPMPYIINNGEIKELKKVKGFYLGYDKRTKYELGRTRLEKDDVLLLYSDAIKEIFDEDENLISSDHVLNILKKFGQGANRDIELFLSSLAKLAYLPLEDDTTLIELHNIGEYEGYFESNSVDSLDDLLDDVRDVLERYDYDKDSLEKISVALEEMYINAVVHGNKRDLSKTVKVNYHVNCESAEIDIRDEGTGFNIERIEVPTDSQLLKDYIANDITEKYTHGRGIWITKKYMDKTEYLDRGRRVVFSKYRLPNRTRFQYYNEDYESLREELEFFDK